MDNHLLGGHYLSQYLGCEYFCIGRGCSINYKVQLDVYYNYYFI